MTSGVRIDKDGSVLRVTLCRPDVRNAQTPATWRALAEIPEMIAGQDVRAIVVSGDGESFSSGLDRRMIDGTGIDGETSLVELAQGSDDDIDAFICAAQRGFTWPDDVAAPVIGYVHGHAIGAGFQLALACDMVFVDPSARFAMRETSLGLVPDLAGTGPLIDAVGYLRAFEVCLSGRWIEAQEAHQMGIATGIVPREAWEEHQQALFTSLAGILPGATASLKQLLRDPEARERQRRRERSAQIGRLRELMSGSGA